MLHAGTWDAYHHVLLAGILDPDKCSCSTQQAPADVSKPTELWDAMCALSTWIKSNRELMLVCWRRVPLPLLQAEPVDIARALIGRIAKTQSEKNETRAFPRVTQRKTEGVYFYVSARAIP